MKVILNSLAIPEEKRTAAESLTRKHLHLPEIPIEWEDSISARPFVVSLGLSEHMQVQLFDGETKQPIDSFGTIQALDEALSKEFPQPRPY